MHSGTDGDKAFSYSQTPLIAFLREGKSNFFYIYINRYGFSSYFGSHLIPATHTGMILLQWRLQQLRVQGQIPTQAGGAPTAASPRPRITPSHTPQGSNSSPELCNPSDPTLPLLFVPRPFWNKPAIPHCSSHLALISHSEFTPFCLQALLTASLGSNPYWVSLVRQQQCQLQDILQNLKKKKENRIVR